MEDFNFENIDIGFWDVIDVLIVGYLIYVIYKLLKGTMAFNIFIGVVLLYVIYYFVGVLEMRMLSLVLGKFVAYGVIILIIIFQPEVRRFLLMLGDSTLKGRVKFLEGLLGDRWSGSAESIKENSYVTEIIDAMKSMSILRHGALLVVAKDLDPSYWGNTGTKVDAVVSSTLLRNIFYKGAPLHDGAVVISDNKILAASVILPVTQSKKISKDLGLRHRAALGMSEAADVICLIVSEETGAVSYAYQGKIHVDKKYGDIKKIITKYIKGKE